ncbi:hypothetical protein HMPREF0971_02466 [Segatella oris F0302]|uniref:Uncharacterized protein n=1 Tax=Segatella oris F0302 TaxID=649760 RepID=D1QTY4_9BACT|nr:hypothetical protein HMPREF0971_02466 [Segatella oris F0302]
MVCIKYFEGSTARRITLTSGMVISFCLMNASLLICRNGKQTHCFVLTF